MGAPTVAEDEDALVAAPRSNSTSANASIAMLMEPSTSRMLAR